MSNILLLKTNLPEFTNDISEEIRLFLDTAQIVVDTNAPHDMCIEVNFIDGVVWRTVAKVFANTDCISKYEFEYDVAVSKEFTDTDHISKYEPKHNAVINDEIVIKRHRKRCVKIAVFRALRKVYPNAFVPWGSLTGIRPTKLLRELEAEMSAQDAADTMISLFDVQQNKYAVAKGIVDVQRNVIRSVKENDIDIYIGIPYCKTKCLYCSFASDVRTSKTDMRPYIDALKKDIELGAKLIHDNGYNIRAAYMGGGTPTVLTESELYEVLAHATKCYGSLGVEFTAEAGRPDTITKQKLEILRDFNVGRVSVNPQSMNEKTLELIGRSHSPQQLQDAFSLARELGFIINMDIITCLPGENIADLEYTLRCIEDMQPENLTVHTLALKRSSRLKQTVKQLQSMMPDAITADKMVARGGDTARNLGMRAYYMYRQKYMRGNLENIGYALPGCDCIYNIDMMEETVSIMAHGAGSMSKRIFNDRTLRVERIPNPKDVATYIAKLDAVYADKSKLFERQ